MSELNNESCEKCKYFSSGLSEKGYCKLYHHNISEPERICSRFEKKDEKPLISRQECETKKALNISEFKYKYTRRLGYLIGIVCAFIMIVALLLVDIVFAVELHPHSIPLPVKMGTHAVVLSMFLFFTWHTMMLLRKYRWVAIPYFIISTLLVLIVIFDFSNVWLTLNNWLNRIIDYIFYDLHNG